MLGGPLYQALLRLRLLEPPIGLVGRRITVSVALTWLPLVVLSWAAGMAFGGTKVPFFHDVDTHVRLLIALPMLLAAEPIVHERLMRAVREFTERGIVAEGEQKRFAAIIDDVMRLRNSMAIELVLLAAAIGVGYWIWREQFASRVGTWYLAPGGEALTLAGAWYAIVSLSLLRFVLFRWYFRLLLWYLFLWRVSRLPLRLNALHPDGAAGIGFLGGTLGAIAPVLVAQSAIVAGSLAGQLIYEGASLDAFRLEIGTSIVLLALIGIAPLVSFTPALIRVGRDGRREYGSLSMRYVEEFRHKWMQGGRADPLVGSSDIQSLADLGSAHERVGKSGAFPVSRQAIVRIVIVIALPFAPLALTKMPLNELISRVLKQVI